MMKTHELDALCTEWTAFSSLLGALFIILERRGDVKFRLEKNSKTIDITFRDNDDVYVSKLGRSVSSVYAKNVIINAFSDEE